jgi:outer membrane autotransporter protein
MQGFTGSALYLKNTRLTVSGNLVLDEGSVLNFEIDFQNKTAPVLFLPGKTEIGQGVKLEIINLTPNATPAKVLIITGEEVEANWENLEYDTDKYELSFENGRLYITNK